MWGAIVAAIGNVIGGAQKGAQAQYASRTSSLESSIDYERVQNLSDVRTAQIILLSATIISLLAFVFIMYRVKKST